MRGEQTELAPHQITELLNIPVALLFDDLPGSKRNGPSNLMNEFVEFLGTTLGQGWFRVLWTYAIKTFAISRANPFLTPA
jgi:hypothetical protein